MALSAIFKDIIAIDTNDGHVPPALQVYEDFGDERFISLSELLSNTAIELNKVSARCLVTAMDQVGSKLKEVFEGAFCNSISVFKVQVRTGGEVFINRDAWRCSVDQQIEQYLEGKVSPAAMEAISMINTAIENSATVSRSYLYQNEAVIMNVETATQIADNIHQGLAQIYEDNFRIKAHLTFRRSARYRGFLPAPE